MQTGEGRSVLQSLTQKEPTRMALQRRSYSAGYKLQVSEYATKKGNRAAERKFGVSEKLVRDWRKAKALLTAMKKTKKANRGLKPRWPQLEERVHQWVLEQRAAGRGLTRMQLRLQAQLLAKEMNIDNFAGGPTWCYRFMQRKRLSFKAKTPNLSADSEAMTDCIRYEYTKDHDPEPLQIKEEPEEPWGDQEGQQLLLNQEPDVKVEFMSECEEKSEDGENFMFEFKEETDQDCSLQNIPEDSEAEQQNKAASSTSTGSHLGDQETFDPPSIAAASTLNRKRKRKTRLDGTDVMNAFLEIQQQQHEDYMRAEELRHQQETQMLRDWMKADREMEERHLELQSQTNHMFERIMTRLLDFMVPPTHQKMSRAQQTPHSFFLDC